MLAHGAIRVAGRRHVLGAAGIALLRLPVRCLFFLEVYTIQSSVLGYVCHPAGRHRLP
jgi:hypothetical protein